MNRVWVCVSMVMLVWLFNFAGAKKPTLTFRVHVQTEGKDMSAKQAFPIELLNPKETIVVSALAELTENDIIGITSWPSDDQGMAVKVQFSRHGADMLSNMTLQDQGKIMVVIINGRIIYAPVIDMTLNEGVLTIPRGVLSTEIPQLEAIAQKNTK